MPADLLVARNPEPDSTLLYLIRVPLGDRGIVLKTKSSSYSVRPGNRSDWM